MKTSKILVVDDEEDIREILQFNLGNEGFLVDVAASGEEAIEKLGEDCSLILLDVMLGGMSGYHVAKRLREEDNRIPIIFLTAKGSENDLLTGFSVGGDDYISKPFSIREVIVRIKAVIRRHSPQLGLNNEPEEVVVGDVKLSRVNKCLYLGTRPVALTKKEFEICGLLIQHPNQIYTREHILRTIWAEDSYVSERTVDVHVSRLRKKMEEYGACICNRSGYGYSFNDSFCVC